MNSYEFHSIPFNSIKCHKKSIKFYEIPIRFHETPWNSGGCPQKSSFLPKELRRQREEKAALREAERLEKAESKGKSAAKDRGRRHGTWDGWYPQMDGLPLKILLKWMI